MAQLTINTTTLMGSAAPNAGFTIRLFREGIGATSVIHGASGVVTQQEYRRTTDNTGEATVELAPTASFGVQTYYEIRIGDLTGRFTMPETDAVLTDRLQSEDVEVQATTGVDAGEVRQLIAVEVSDWALDGNTDPIPANKLTNAPAAGLDRAAVDARVQAGVADWAEAGAPGTIPDNKIPSGIARDSEVPTDGEIDARARAVVASGVEDFAKPGNAALVPDAKIPDSIARDSEIPSVVGLQTEAQVDARVRALTENFAEVGSGTQIPDSRIPSNIARDSELPDVSGFRTEAEINTLADRRVEAGVADWAEEGDTSQIPLNKLGNAPSGGGGGGLTVAQVDARVEAGVADWAEEGDTSTIPDAKIPSGIARDSELPDVSSFLDAAAVDSRISTRVEDFAEAGNAAQIPDAKIPSTIARDSEIPSITGLQNQSQVDTRIRALTENFAEVGNGTLIPDSKIPANITRDSELPDVSGFLSQAQVDARVTAGVSDWAEEGNSDQIPLNKLGNAPGGGGGATTFAALTDTPSALGTAGQQVIVNPAGDALVFADAAPGTGGGGGGGFASRELARSQINVTGGGTFADTGIAESVWGSADWLIIEVGAPTTTSARQGATQWLRTQRLRDLGASAAGQNARDTSNSPSIFLGFMSNDATNNVGGWVFVGKTAGGSLLVTTAAPAQDFYDLVLRGVDETTEGGGSGSSTLVGLTDTPDALGTAGQVLAVNGTADATEWVDAATGGGGSGLTEAQVDARVAAGVWDWAEFANPDDIPVNKLGVVEDWAFKHLSNTQIPSAKIADALEVQRNTTADDYDVGRHEMRTVMGYFYGEPVDVSSVSATITGTGNGMRYTLPLLPAGDYLAIVGATTTEEPPDFSVDPGSSQQNRFDLSAGVSGGRTGLRQVSSENRVVRRSIVTVSDESTAHTETFQFFSNDDRSNLEVEDVKLLAFIPVEPRRHVPVGGLEGEVLVKSSDTDRDVEWVNRDVESWAEAGSSDLIPVDKVHGTAATEAEVDSKIMAQVEEWARVGITTPLPDDKIPGIITRDTEIFPRVDLDRGELRALRDYELDSRPLSEVTFSVTTTALADGTSVRRRFQLDASMYSSRGGRYLFVIHVPDASVYNNTDYRRVAGTEAPPIASGAVPGAIWFVYEWPSTNPGLVNIIPGTTGDLSGSELVLIARLSGTSNRVPFGGTTSQVLAKASGTDYDTEWVDAATGGGGGGLTTAQVDARIADWAETGNTDDIPAGKLANQRFTEADEAKLDGIADSADNNVRSDWNQTNAAMDDFIRNKPTIPDPADWAESGNSDQVPANKLGNQRFTAADETKLDGIQAGAQANVGEEFTTADHTKLDGIETGAQRNVGVEYTAAARTKLDGIQANAEVNIPADWDATGGDAAIRNKPADGELVPSGGTTGQVLSKTSATNYDTEWADAATGGATSFVALTDTPATLGTAGQVAAVNAAGNALEFVDAASGTGGGGGNATRPLGSGNFDVTVARRFATEANSADITWDDSDWFYFSVGSDIGGVFVFTGSYYRVLGDDIRGLLAQTYGAEIADGNPPGYLSVRVFSDSEHTIFLGRTADNKVLVSASGTGDDALPFTLYGESAATGGGGGGASDFTDLADTPDALGSAGQVPVVSSDGTALIFGDQAAAEAFSDLTDTPATLGTAGQALIVNATGTGLDYADVGEAGEVQLAVGDTLLPVGPVREVTRGTVPDDTALLPNTTEFTIPISATGRELDSSITVAADNLSITATEAGTFVVQIEMRAAASTLVNADAPLNGGAVIRPEGELLIYGNGGRFVAGAIAYARYGRWSTKANGSAHVTLEAGQTMSFSILLERIDSAVGSLEWTGRIRVKHLTVTGSSTIIGVRSDTVTNMITLTQSAYDALPSPSADTYYIIVGA